jgi:hypothetical protein
METSCSSRMLAPLDRTTLRHIPEDCDVSDFVVLYFFLSSRISLLPPTPLTPMQIVHMIRCREEDNIKRNLKPLKTKESEREIGTTQQANYGEY